MKEMHTSFIMIQNLGCDAEWSVSKDFTVKGYVASKTNIKPSLCFT
jgi:hypothetical protein